MAKRTGSADLPLHAGRVPAWLGQRMSALGVVICQAIVHHYGRDELLRRLAHPFWFQSFGAVMGMDWHSSGITTSVIGALKRGLAPLQRELGVHVCGGRGRHSRRTPDELALLGDRVGVDAVALTRASRLVAKVDSAAVQDGFDLYLHGFFVTDDSRWTVVQQGMNGAKRQARRYHWQSEGLTSFVEAPHSAIDGPSQGNIINLTDRRAARSRSAQLDLLATLGPDCIVEELAALSRSASEPNLPHLVMPAHHDVRSSDVFARRLHGTLAAAADRGLVDFPELLLTPGDPTRRGRDRLLAGNGQLTGSKEMMTQEGAPAHVDARGRRRKRTIRRSGPIGERVEPIADQRRPCRSARLDPGLRPLLIMAFSAHLRLASS
jgi:hypothetical protein